MLAASILRSMVEAKPLDITAGYVLGAAAGDEDKRLADERMEATLDIMSHGGRREKRVIHSESIPGGIARVGREYDMVVIGAAKEPFFRKVLFGEIPEKVARYTKSAVMVVKQYEGPVKSILKRILG
jgi:nucleotide-binding universal stress UspA family protein